MKTDIAYIYTLIDPRDNVVRYVGKTINPKKRLAEHLRDKSETYRMKWIRTLLSLEMKPIFKIVKICPLSEFIKFETEFIKKYQSNKLTNSDETGQGATNRKRELVENSNYRRRSVYQYNLDGLFIKEFISTRDASRKLKITHAAISRCCNGIFKHTSGFIFTYDKNKLIESIKNPNAAKKPVIEIDKSGNEMNRWISIMKCSRDTKLDHGNISRVCNNILPSIRGRMFKFL